jgi:hypothetical protein
MTRMFLFTIAFMLANIFHASGQRVNVPLTLDRWDTIKLDKEDTASIKINKEIYLGKECIVLQSGIMVLKDVNLKDGSIEADISFPQERSFPGFAVRMQDINNYESFYLRPHQSGNPDATQYTPEFNGETGFQLYYGEGYDGAFTFRFNEWHHIKIELDGLQAVFYIDDMPVIKVKELLTGWKTGKIAIGAGGALLRIANVQYTVRQRAAPTLIPISANGTGGIITHWEISNVVNRNLFKKQYHLTPEIKKKLKWTMQTSEPSGTMNLAKFARRTDTANTIVTRLIIHSGAKQIEELSFGFSDYVTVYLNDDALYYGADKQYSRDYRFLGTIGYFDKIFLRLKKGDNELWFVVSEDFGGWGMKAKFENMDKISLE